MVREFIMTATFMRSWEYIGLGDPELRALQIELLQNPKAGDPIKGTGGARKYRIQLDQRGKSGGARVIYVDVYESKHLYLLLAYPKKKQDDMTPEQVRAIRTEILRIKEAERNGRSEL